MSIQALYVFPFSRRAKRYAHIHDISKDQSGELGVLFMYGNAAAGREGIDELEQERISKRHGRLTLVYRQKPVD